MDIRDKNVLLTGAGRGLGAALARRLGRVGARLVLVARSAEVEAVAAGIRAAGGQAHALRDDLGDKEAPHRIAGAAAALVGPIDVLVHNASTLGPLPLRPLLDTDCEDLQAVLETNLIGPFRLTKVLAGSMALRGGGLILQLSSDAAVVGYPGWGAYGVSKAALDQLGRVLAAELDGSGVRVLSIDPGEMDTRMHADAVPEADRTLLQAPDAVAARLEALIASAEQVPNGARLEAGAASGDGS